MLEPNRPHATGQHERIVHGGDLAEAERRYGHARSAWLDLSTGISPHAYPVPPPAADSWHRLPNDDDDLAEVAAAHYRCTHALPIAGSQDAIRILPTLLEPVSGTFTAMAALTYGEYRPAFARAGHAVWTYCADPALAGSPSPSQPAPFVLRPYAELPHSIRHLVLVNPNNPSAEHYAPDVVMHWHAQLAARGGTLIVDEAYADVMPGLSVAHYCDRPGLIVLRSIGKFFGLAGARVGFALAESQRLQQLQHALGAWRVSGPARAAARAALLDTRWQAAALLRLQADGARLCQLLERHALPARGTPLFAWVRHPGAAELQAHLARHAIWVRRFDTQASLRFGLPGTDAAWLRLEQALATWQSGHPPTPI